jgi:hypothetical protein
VSVNGYRSGVQFLEEQEFFPSLSRRDLVEVTGISVLVVGRTKLEADHYPYSSTGIRNTWLLKYIFQYVFRK